MKFYTIYDEVGDDICCNLSESEKNEYLRYNPLYGACLQDSYEDYEEYIQSDHLYDVTR